MVFPLLVFPPRPGLGRFGKTVVKVLLGTSGSGLSSQMEEVLSPHIQSKSGVRLQRKSR